MRLIDADALKAFIKANGFVYANTIDTFPTIDPVKHGRWNGYTTSAYMGMDEYKEPKWAERKFYRCSECHTGSAVQHRYCPNCGARMDGEV